MESLTSSPKQLKLFHIKNPFSVRMGPDFFRSLPSGPGVYFFYGKDGALLYIGQSSDLKARIGSYRHVNPEKNPKRTLRLVHRVVRIEWKECVSPQEAIELESVLLLEHRPLFNRAGVWRGDPWFLKIESSTDRLHLELIREQSGIGPLPSPFRYVMGSLVRCIFRLYLPSAPLSSYPHGLFGAAVPLTLSIPPPDAVAAAKALRAYADGQYEPLLSKLEGMPLGASESQQEYWQEELERLKKYAAKAQKVRESAELKPAARINTSTFPAPLSDSMVKQSD